MSLSFSQLRAGYAIDLGRDIISEGQSTRFVLGHKFFFCSPAE